MTSFRKLVSSFVASNGNAPDHTASALFVILHNLVTDTISANFSSVERHKFQCLPDVLRQLGSSLVPEASSIAATLPGELQANGLPGFGSHRLVTC